MIVIGQGTVFQWSSNLENRLEKDKFWKRCNGFNWDESPD